MVYGGSGVPSTCITGASLRTFFESSGFGVRSLRLAFTRSGVSLEAAVVDLLRLLGTTGVLLPPAEGVAKVSAMKMSKRGSI